MAQKMKYSYFDLLNTSLYTEKLAFMSKVYIYIYLTDLIC